jgi:phage terminase small subunit
MKLAGKQLQFVKEYVKDRNGTQAAIRAGYSEKTAYSIAANLLRKVEVVSAIEEQTAAIEKAATITPARVMQEYARIAFFDPRKLFDDDGTPKAVTDLDDDTAAAVSGIEIVTIGNSEIGVGQVRKYRIADKKGALDSVAKILGMMTDKTKIDVDETLKELLAMIVGAGTDALTRIRNGTSGG